VTVAPLDKKVLKAFGYAIIAIYLGGIIWGEIAYRYFRHKCNSQSGEFIYRTEENVEGIYQMRLRDPKDYFDRVRKGDIPEDPFGHTNVEAQRPWILFLRDPDPKDSYLYFETSQPPDERLIRLSNFRFENIPQATGEPYWVYRRVHEARDDAEHNNISAMQTSQIQSRYGFTWRELRNAWDWVFGVWGGELVAVDVETGEELAIRRGFILWATLSDRTGICPNSKTDMTTGYFLKKVLKPPRNPRG